MSEVTLNTAVSRVPGEASAPRSAPVATTGAVAWLRANLFSSWISTALTLVLGYFLIRWTIGFIDWAFIQAVWRVPVAANGVADTTACRDVKGVGACWAVITEKHRFMLFGTYPYEEHWRPLLVCVLFVVLYVVSAMRRFWRWELALFWVFMLTLIGVLMWGGVLGLSHVPAGALGRAARSRSSCPPSAGLRLPALHPGGAGPALQAAGDQGALRALRRADPRRAADLAAVHGRA
jgi:general L-amino acid transport system permease protein